MLGLLVSGFQILAARLHFYENLALPEAVRVALRTIEEFDAVLEGRHLDGIDTKHGEELLQATRATNT